MCFSFEEWMFVYVCFMYRALVKGVVPYKVETPSVFEQLENIRQIMLSSVGAQITHASSWQAAFVV